MAYIIHVLDATHILLWIMLRLLTLMCLGLDALCQKRFTNHICFPETANAHELLTE